jgi:hypothetical protein
MKGKEAQGKEGENAGNCCYTGMQSKAVLVCTGGDSVMELPNSVAMARVWTRRERKRYCTG